ncbi:hypothetical protein QR680_016107 [Steinernema hermaphroditum]|uniref:Uncharacterized protein n=1 Tax=Steinernema hermaphroditum TaxID=289476 RepID=A0AA39LM10_9BILA|nr:hypothetical protein QR680_016107 [Steinernema hermaphroditum]
MGFVATAYSFLHYNIPNGKPVPEGCFSFNCMTAKDGNVRFWYSIFIVCITLAITILGSYMLYLLHKHKKRTYSVVEKKTNTFALYVFYVRFICVTVPFFADILLSKIANVDLGKHIGPFATYGSTVDYTVKVIVYYTLAARHKKISYRRAGATEEHSRKDSEQATVELLYTAHRKQQAVHSLGEQSHRSAVVECQKYEAQVSDEYDEKIIFWDIPNYTKQYQFPLNGEYDVLNGNNSNGSKEEAECWGLIPCDLQ